jgi:hypothetical protein
MRIVIRSTPNATESNGVLLQSELREAVRLLDRHRMQTVSADVFNETMVIALEHDSDSDKAMAALAGAGFRVSTF